MAMTDSNEFQGKSGSVCVFACLNHKLKVLCLSFDMCVSLGLNNCAVLFLYLLVVILNENLT